MVEFREWPKIARLNRDIIVTEKIDGTNAAIIIVLAADDDEHNNFVAEVGAYRVYAQSRTRMITPLYDNFGFAKWVQENVDSLFLDLGPGTHFGEWWGQGIQRKYSIGERRFSLFNTHRWADYLPDAAIGMPAGESTFDTPGLAVVPVLYRGPYSEPLIKDCLDALRWMGSAASPGFMKPEGVVVYHVAANTMFKVTLEGDEAPKSLAAS